MGSWYRGVGGGIGGQVVGEKEGRGRSKCRRHKRMEGEKLV